MIDTLLDFDGVDYNAALAEFKTYLSDCETSFQVKVPNLNNAEMISIIALGLFISNKQLKTEKADLLRQINEI